MTNTHTQALSDAGVSIWLDDLSRNRISTGNLAGLIEEWNVVGVTTNPTIFAGALKNGEAYASQLRPLAQSGASVTDIVFELTTSDVTSACDLFRGVYAQSAGFNGRVSIEVEPGLAHDAAGTVAQAKALWAKVDRPNAMIKIPATEEGLSAIADVIAEGISVNVTLIFSLDRYRDVISAYLDGLERARAAGIDLSTIHSVASFFVSRVDTEIDRRLQEIGSEEALALTGLAGLANARLAYELFETEFAGERAKTLLEAGANVQRPLWASTGVKDPNLPDTLYVSGLVAPHVVNTMPEKTLAAFADHGETPADSVRPFVADARDVLARLAAVHVSYGDVTATLEREGVEKFIASWNELLDDVALAAEAAR
ncbi:MAG TPA: transaldolase [Microbacteriaceae bacterium]|nr:transaldolase [Microbacteriaceae bacterium]